MRVAVSIVALLVLARPAAADDLKSKATIAVEHKVASYFKAKAGGFWKFMRYFCAWLVLFGSKFVILEAVVLTFGDRLSFGGPFHGVVALIVVVVVMLVVEAVLVKVYRSMD